MNLRITSLKTIMSRFLNAGQVLTFQKNVAISGTPEQLGDHTISDGVSIVVKAKAANTGGITIGGSSAQALNSGTSFFKLAPNEAVTAQVSNTNAIWIDATVSGEGVEVFTEF